MLYRGRDIFINGERVRAGTAAFRTLAKLADARELPPQRAPGAPTRQFLYDWYVAGYISIKR